MGHVDHGKTSLLDAIRHSQVAASESGGITQHIGAYTVHRDGQSITFIDTPGHEAFTAMRARGARATDIAIIVIAADDGVMPQTREALDHARAAGVPIIVAVSKIDLQSARPQRVLEQMAELDYVPDSWGGNTFFVPVSAVTGDGLTDLLDAILLVAEEVNPLANPRRPARGIVLEGRVDQKQGVMASVLVQTGTLRRGDVVVIEAECGRIRAMFDETGARVREAGPSMPVEIMGLSAVPTAGARFEAMASEKEGRVLAARRESSQRDRLQPDVHRPTTLEELFADRGSGPKALNLIVKTDVQGMLEPVVSSLRRLEGEIGLNILHAAAGEIGENDINLAAASDAVVIGFRVGMDAPARRAAMANDIQVREYDVIYNLIEDIQDALTGMLAPTYRESLIGEAEVRAVFHISRSGNVAGCQVARGVVRRNASAHVRRAGEIIATSPIASLRRFTDDVREVREGFECGIGLVSFEAFEVGDVLECFVMERER
jgi:translation initiation factor IF-2